MAWCRACSGSCAHQAQPAVAAWEGRMGTGQCTFARGPLLSGEWNDGQGALHAAVMHGWVWQVAAAAAAHAGSSSSQQRRRGSPGVRTRFTLLAKARMRRRGREGVHTQAHPVLRRAWLGGWHEQAGQVQGGQDGSAPPPEHPCRETHSLSHAPARTGDAPWRTRQAGWCRPARGRGVGRWEAFPAQGACQTR